MSSSSAMLKSRSFGILVLTFFGTFWAVVSAAGLNLAATVHLGGTEVFLWAVVIGSGYALILWLTVIETLFRVRTQLRQEKLIVEASA